jgi:hypothetical protein
LKVTDVELDQHRFTIRKAKASNNTIVLASKPIEAALQMH